MLLLKVNGQDVNFQKSNIENEPLILENFPQIIRNSENVRNLSTLSTEDILSILNTKDFCRPPIKHLSSFIIKMCDGREINEQIELLKLISMFGISCMSIDDLEKLKSIVGSSKIDIFPQLENVISILEENYWKKFESVPFVSNSIIANIQNEKN